jgi:hypothetical protein
LPAAELTRLRTQIAGLILHFEDPAGLRIALRDLLDLYANRAYRPGHAIQPQPLLPTYRVPALVTRQLEMELGKVCQEKPVAALAAIEPLWRDPYLEPRLLAITLLGIIPASHGEAVVEKIRVWAKPKENTRILDALFENGTVGLRRSAAHLLLGLIEEWINSSNTDIQALGIRALVPMVRDPIFQNLPPVFRLLSPLMQTAPAALQTDLQIVTEALAKYSPTETVYFLRQVLSLSSGSGTARLIRRCLPAFTAEQQASLRRVMSASNNG